MSPYFFCLMIFNEKTKPTNMNIIYKDFMAITLVSTQEGLKIYATPIEWLYEYPTVDNGTNLEKNETDKQFYLLYVKPRKHEDIVDFLKFYKLFIALRTLSAALMIPAFA